MRLNIPAHNADSQASPQERENDTSDWLIDPERLKEWAKAQRLRGDSVVRELKVRDGETQAEYENRIFGSEYHRRIFDE